ncbi:Ribosome maturation factor rimM [Desulfurobacterium thermolithotrophum DSM 11699]|uniref:Ribosome maturation factor RimM n=1 Tax=Desulfurobacterium thermolithotrophum (strain DSM 11699 / BSA) TaxID=868864 RepID=F0S1W7_DESTD|nr:ribosome maturation factor RimM [Desulfurobacterium thermolithotrophum]ADY74048.1 Ribosome maturation factor rimM [Desulfurobacterium thermolithotrophum DSM 11699]
MKKKGIRAILERRKRKAFDHKDEVMIGKIVGVHGIKGEVKIKPESDIFEKQMEALDLIPVYRGTKREELCVEKLKPYKNLYIVKFKEINDRGEAEERVGGELWIDKNKQVELGEGEFYFSDLIGSKVFTDDGKEVGILKEILEQPAGHIFEVEKSDGSKILIPFISQFVKDVDIENKRIVVSLIEGME